MTHIPYVDPASVTDTEILGYLEKARREGTPRPESQAIRAHNPAVIRAFSQAWELIFRQGVCDHRIKELAGSTYHSPLSASTEASSDPSRLGGKA